MKQDTTVQCPMREAHWMDLRQVWEDRARQWRDWARAPGHDSYWAYSGSFFTDVFPERPGLVLDLGCGEGRVTRSIAKRSEKAVGIDASPTLIQDAVAADEGPSYLVGDATDLPFRSKTFDAVVAYNSLMDLNDMTRGVAESGRVLKTRGNFCVCILHPIGDAGLFTSDDEDAPFVIGNYMRSHRYDQQHERNGLEMHFTSWHHPLAHYAKALEDAGLLIERLREPVPDYEALGRKQWTRGERIPLFLFIRAIKA